MIVMTKVKLLQFFLGLVLGLSHFLPIASQDVEVVDVVHCAGTVEDGDGKGASQALTEEHNHGSIAVDGEGEEVEG